MVNPRSNKTQDCI